MHCEGLGSATHPMIDCDLECQGAGVGGIITSTFFSLFILSLLNLYSDKSQHRSSSPFLSNIFSSFMS